MEEKWSDFGGSKEGNESYKETAIEKDTKNHAVFGIKKILKT